MFGKIKRNFPYDYTFYKLFHQTFSPGILTRASPGIITEYLLLTEDGCLCRGENF